MRRISALGLLLFSLALGPSAQAHTIPMTATKDAPPAQAWDATTQPTQWSFTVQSISGKPSQAFLAVYTDVDNDGDFEDAVGVLCKPKVGRVCENGQVSPAGTHYLYFLVRGGSGPASVSVLVDHTGT
jgi:hypothetical protein